jgi:hypothetical protein
MFPFKKKDADTNVTPLPRNAVEELQHLYALIEKLNIPVIADDYEAGYDTAIDEVLDIVSGRIKFLSGK